MSQHTLLQRLVATRDRLRKAYHESAATFRRDPPEWNLAMGWTVDILTEFLDVMHQTQCRTPVRDNSIKYYCGLHHDTLICENGVCHDCNKVAPGECCLPPAVTAPQVPPPTGEWLPMREEAKQAGEVLVYANRMVVAHWADHIEDHPPIVPGWYYNRGGSYFDLVEGKPTCWMRIPGLVSEQRLCTRRKYRS